MAAADAGSGAAADHAAGVPDPERRGSGSAGSGPDLGGKRRGSGAAGTPPGDVARTPDPDQRGGSDSAETTPDPGARGSGFSGRAASTSVATRPRLDVLLVTRGLFPSREQAAAAVLAGQVEVSGRAQPKPGMRVKVDQEVAVHGPAHPYVGRGGQKLAAALDGFGLDPAGLVALDVGASTGGFTDCLLQRGAARVYAVDVGYGQIAWRLREDPRVVVMERINARYLRAGDLPEPIDLAVIDVSFISLGKILPAVIGLLRADGDVVALCKPQFEAGPGDVPRGGVVRDAGVHAAVLRAVADAAAGVGWPVVAAIASPITGADGNREFLLHLRQRGLGMTEALLEQLAGPR